MHEIGRHVFSYFELMLTRSSKNSTEKNLIQQKFLLSILKWNGFFLLFAIVRHTRFTFRWAFLRIPLQLKVFYMDLPTLPQYITSDLKNSSWPDSEFFSLTDVSFQFAARFHDLTVSKKFKKMQITAENLRKNQKEEKVLTFSRGNLWDVFFQD